MTQQTQEAQQTLNAFDKIDFFKFKEIFYTNDQLWRQLNDSQKAQNWFMMQRNIAIAYPTIVQHFNVVGMNAAVAANACHLFLLGQRQPRWSFISAKKNQANAEQVQQTKEQQAKQDIDKFDAWVKHEFCIANDIDKKCFEDFCRFHPVEALEQLNELKQQLEGMQR